MSLKDINKKTAKWGGERNLFIVLIIAFIGLGMLKPQQFFTASNISSMAFQVSEFGIFALAMMAVIMTGGINLSLVTTGTMVSIVGAFVLSSDLGKNNPWLAMLLTLLLMLGLAALMGVLNAAFIAFVGVPALLATLGTSAVFEGVGLNITKGGAISGFPDSFMYIGNGDILGLPFPILIYLILVVGSYFLLERSVWGVNLHMVGSNRIATEYSGVNTKKVIAKVYVYSAMMSAVAGLIMMSRYNSAKSDYGSSYLMQAVTAAVLGGTSIYGGTGTVLGTVLATFIIQVVTTGLNINNVDKNLVDISIGLILLSVLMLRHFTQRLADKKLIKERKQAAAKSA